MPKARRHKLKRKFWEVEYATPSHLALSAKPSEDLKKFVRYLERETGKMYLNPLASVLDLGCGNGRNLIFLARSFGMRGVGFDTSSVAIAHARGSSEGLSLTYEVRSIAEPLPTDSASQTLVLDMMTSHYLSKEERERLYGEIHRVLKPNGWLFLKTFLRDDDAHAARLLREHPAEEASSYIHPEIGLVEHVFSEDEIVKALAKRFTIHKVYKSHRHKDGGRAAKRRSISVYAQNTS